MWRFLEWGSLFGRKRFESGMTEEFAFHMEARTQDLMRSGLSAEEARRQAYVEFGASERYGEECQEAYGLQWVDTAIRTLRYAVRSLRRSRAFTVTAIVSLALGIGVNTLVFSVISSLLLRPFPVAHPERTVFVETPSGPGVSFPSYREFRDANRSFEGLAAYRMDPINIDIENTPSRIWGYLATGNYFDVLGVKPALGRFFHQEDDVHPGASPYAVLSYATWQSRFAGNPKIAGTTIRINGMPYTILGVAPRGFHGTEVLYWPEVWVPMMMEPQIEANNPWLDDIHDWNTWMLGLLRPGVTRSQATADLNRIAGDLARKYPDTDTGLRMVLSEPGLMGSMLRGPVKAFTGGLLFVSGLVLLMACTNLAGLMLARGTDRQREVAIQFSLGAGRMQIVKQLLTEAVLVALCGGAVGCAMAAVLANALSQWRAPIDFPGQCDVSADWRVFVFAAIASLLAGVLFGLGPALRNSLADLNQVIKGSITVSRVRRRFPVRDTLVAVQFALCFVLVFGSTLSLRALQRALVLPLGLNPQGVSTAAIDLSSSGYDQIKGRQFQERLVDSLRQTPGFTTVSYGNSLPLSIDQSATAVQDESASQGKGRNLTRVNFYEVAPRYLETLEVPLLQGRDFDNHDDERAPPVAIVNETFARRIMHTTNPVGRSFRYGFGTKEVMVIGLVADGKYVSLTEAPRPALFRPIAQMYNPTTTILVRSQLVPADVIERIRKQIAQMDPQIPIYGAGSLMNMLGFALFPMHAAALALSAFGILSLMLAITSIYGLVAYTVARRQRELGIRIALGARPSGVLQLVMGNVARLIFAGLVTGVALALGSGVALTSVVYGVSPRDPEVFATVAIVLIGAAGAAALGPGVRALRTDPMTALRYE